MSHYLVSIPTPIGTLIRSSYDADSDVESDVVSKFEG